MIDRIMVCVDGSAHSQRALEFSREIVKRFGAAHVTVIHVVPSTAVFEGMDVWRVNVMSYLDDFGKTLLENSRVAMESLDAHVESILAHGDPGSQIVKIAREREVDLIVMGSRGISGLASVVLGSVGERVVRNAPCSVFIVREEEVEEDFE